MTSRFSTTSLAGAAFVVVAVIVVAWPLPSFWLESPDYSHGIVVPVFALAAGLRAFEETRGLARPASLVERRFAAGLVSAGSLVLPVAYYLEVQLGPLSVLPLWGAAVALVVMTLGLFLGELGARATRALVFPVLFLLLALPAPVLGLFQYWLRLASTSISEVGLAALGVPVVREGFVLRLPSGSMGVTDACSGIRSFITLLTVAPMLAYLRRASWRGHALLVGAIVPLVLASNTFRIVLSGALLERVGPSAITGTPHAVLGGVTFAAALAILYGLSTKLTARRAGHTSGEVEPVACAPPAPLRSVAVVGLAALVVLGARATCPARAPAVQVAGVAPTLDRWASEEVEIDPEIRQILDFDSGLHRYYRSDSGRTFEVWALVWNTSDFFGPHSPDLCWDLQGWVPRSHEVRPLRPAGRDFDVPVSRRELEKGPERRSLLYWAELGEHVRTEEEWTLNPWVPLPLENLLRPLRTPSPRASAGQLFVSVSVDEAGAPEAAAAELDDFARHLASEIYRLYPWAVTAPR